MVEQTQSVPPEQKELPIASPHGERQDSLFTRISTSTSTLMRQTLLPSQLDDMTAGLASLSSTTTKGNPSSGPSGPSGSSLRHAESSHSAQPDAKPPSHQSSFREQSIEISGLAELEYNSFLANAHMATNGIIPDYGLHDDLPCPKGKEKSPQIYDGAAVVELLCDPNFAFDDLSDFCVQDKSPNLWTPTADSIKLLDRLKAELPPAPMHRPPSPMNCLNLLPVFDSQYTQTTTDIGPWLDVLMNYQDKVWGELLPLVEEAHEELRAVLNGGGTQLNECAAIRRLGLILGHINTPINTTQIVHI